ncbi:hypothetical protein ACFQWB_13770 [Paenibacillus thermoaerophilus]|uniref:Uncharacterized protein n=1 Tax=Paenibacillus thermoaerophilus TaxID=1215385 RepID=A0ABW2V4C0_9BACL|nr:hypothetical protein [Paenibacillus thermoaerophilus]
MRNILVTVMLLIVVALMFMNIIADSDGTRSQIEAKGNSANTQIRDLTP